MKTGMNRCIVNGLGTFAALVGLVGACGGDGSSGTETTASTTTTVTATANPSTGELTTGGPGTDTVTPTSGGGSDSQGETTTTTTATTDPSGTSTSTTDPVGTTTGTSTGTSTTDPVGTSSTTGGAECGNGQVEGNEQCDDGADNGPGKACNVQCLNNICGDGDVGPDEACDDGNGVDDDDCTNACVVGLPGSCRPSEIYGASGGFPGFTDPAYANFLDKKVIVMTSNNQGDGWVLHVVDISGPPPPANINYNAPKYHNPAWQQANIGRVFGLTLDSFGNIYVAPTTVFGANPSPATIKKIDSKTGLVSNFATLPNKGPAFGNLNYDCVSETIYVSNHDDGRIYQIDMLGQIVSTYRHSDKTVTIGPANDPAEPDGAFIPLGSRVWAVQSHAGRLYYSVWREDTGRKTPESNSVWSVGYSDEKGIADPATAKLEFMAPPYLGQDYSNPISDISFAATGWMLVSQRTMVSDSSTSAHQSTTYEFQYMNGAWVNKGTTFIVGELQGSATGGVDHDFAEGGYVWMSGDALDFYTPNVVYGLQGTPHAGGDITNSTLIDLDGEITQQDKTALGDVEIPIPGDAMPVPEPQ